MMLSDSVDQTFKRQNCIKQRWMSQGNYRYAGSASKSRGISELC